MFLEQYVLVMLQDKLQADRELEKLCVEEADRRTEEIKELSKEMIDRYIDKIVVYNEQHIEIFWQP